MVRKARWGGYLLKSARAKKLRTKSERHRASKCFNVGLLPAVGYGASCVAMRTRMLRKLRIDAARLGRVTVRGGDPDFYWSIADVPDPALGLAVAPVEQHLRAGAVPCEGREVADDLGADRHCREGSEANRGPG